MNFKRRQPPIEVTSWMEKDLSLRKITANSRLLTNDTRQNIVLSRQFFSDLLNLSFSRYRKMAEYDFDKKLFLRNQYKKTENSMPGLRPCVDRLTFDTNRGITPHTQSSRQNDSSLMCPSAQSFLSRSGAKSDPTFNRRQQSSTRQIKTAQIIQTSPNTTLIENSETVSNQRLPSRRQMSRERLNRLATPKGHRFKSAIGTHVRSDINEETQAAEAIFAKVEQTSDVITSPTENNLSERPKSVVHDQRFRHLLGVFSEVHAAETSNLQSRKSIVAANKSLQDDEGLWKMDHPSISSRKSELKYHRQMLAEKLHNKIDIFLIEVGV